jgi:hypothetical protein
LVDYLHRALLGSVDMDAFEMIRTESERFESWVLAVMMADHLTREEAEIVVWNSWAWEKIYGHDEEL